MFAIRDVERWIAFRIAFGLRADETWAVAVARDPTSQNDTGIPLLPSEISKIGVLVRQSPSMIDALRRYGEGFPGEYAGVVTDGARTVLLMKGDTRGHEDALTTLLPSGSLFDVRPARWSTAELARFAATVNDQQPWFATIGAELGFAGLDEGSNRVSVDYLAPSDDLTDAILQHFGRPDWLDLRYGGPIPWAGPRGRLTVRVTGKDGKPIAGLVCEAVPRDPSINADTGNAFSTDEFGRCTDPDLPATTYLVRVSRLEGGDMVKLGEGEASVPPNGSTAITIHISN
jgi:hypothetical protein